MEEKFHLSQRAAAEMLGTAMLVLVGVGSIPATVLLAGKAIPAVRGADLLGISFAFGLIVTVVVYALGKVSGAHINPAVTFGLAVTKRFPWREVPVYWIAQAIGAVLGSLAIWAIFGHTAIKLGMGVASFNQHTTSWGAAIFGEGIGTFLLIFAVLGIVDARSPGELAGIVIGFAVVAIIMVVGPITDAAINPARAFGPMLISAIGGGATHWNQLVPAYILPELAGGGIAAVAYDFMTKPRIVAMPIAEAVTHPDPGPREPATTV